MAEIQRASSQMISIRDILMSKYVKGEGWDPNHIITENDEKVSRVNLIATTISKSGVEDRFSFIVVDDGSGELIIRNFGEIDIFRNINVGDTILVIGKVREYSGQNSSERYIVPEILRSIDKRWLTIRNLQLEHTVHPKKIEDNKQINQVKAEKNEGSPYFSIIEEIKKQDSGDGADIGDVVKTSKDKNAEDMINNLLLRGDIFEIKPGKIKVLE